jgi:choline dehydrogenase-like flavoprotein
MNELARLRPAMRHYAEDEVVDAVVIGTGAGGAPILAKLAAAGMRVVALESGPWWESPAEQFATDELAAAKLYWLDERLSAGDTPEAFGSNNSGTGVGGSMLHWGAFVPRVDPRDLRLATEAGKPSRPDGPADWPLTYDDLLPHYEAVERFLGVSGPAHYPWDEARRYPTPPVPINAPGQLMQRGFSALGLRTSAAPIAALSIDYAQPEYGHRSACVNRGFCHQGCRNGAKATMDVTYLPWAVRSGAEIRPHSFVHGLERDAQGRITAVLYTDSSDPAHLTQHRQRCAAVFLCAGAIETPRLLLHTGLANSSGQVGRNYMAHVATQVWGTFEQPVRMNKGFPATVISEDTLRPPEAGFSGGYLVQSLGVVPVTFAQQVARGRGLFGAPLQQYLDRYNHLAGVGINGDCLPSAKNFLELSTELDRFGVPRPRIHFSYGENETRMIDHASRLLTAAWQAAGASDIWTFPRSAHTIGTCRMGTDPTTSVVDAYGRSHDIANLYVCDNSIFPSALAANPALTIMALALRTAEAFLAGGEGQREV